MEEEDCGRSESPSRPLLFVCAWRRTFFKGKRGYPGVIQPPKVWEISSPPCVQNTHLSVTSSRESLGDG